MYFAPEMLSNYEYSKAGDVYAFGLIVYEIVALKIPYADLKDIFKLIKEVAILKVRPSLNMPINQCYKNLIQKCWDHDPQMRPTFEEIVYNLKNDTYFLSDEIDKAQYLN